MIKLPSIDRSNSEDIWTTGADVYIDPASVIAIEPKQHRYHSFRPAQN